MSTVAVESKQLIKDYLQALSGQPKTEELLDRYIREPELKEHIRQAESAFPAYEVIDRQYVAEDDIVAARELSEGCTRETSPESRLRAGGVSSDFMIFYRRATA